MTKESLNPFCQRVASDTGVYLTVEIMMMGGANILYHSKKLN